MAILPCSHWTPSFIDWPLLLALVVRLSGRVDERPGLPATRGVRDLYGVDRRPYPRPGGEFEIHRQSEGSSELAQSGEHVGEKPLIGFVAVDDRVGGAELRRRFEDRLEIRDVRLLP